MHTLPHRYRVTGAARVEGEIELTADRLATLTSAPPAEFDGPGDRWSPETLLVAAVADCFVLTFRGIARASRLPWISIDADVTGTLDRVDRVMQFTQFVMTVHVVVPAGVDAAAAHQVLEKAERNCLIANSLKAAVTLQATVEAAAPAELLRS